MKKFSKTNVKDTKTTSPTSKGQKSASKAKIHKISDSAKKKRKIVPPKSSTSNKSIKIGESSTTPAKVHKAARKGESNVQPDTAHKIRPKSPKVVGTDKKQKKEVQSSSKSKGAISRKAEASPPKAKTSTASLKKSSTKNVAQPKKRERSRNEDNKETSRSARKMTKSPKPVKSLSKAKARVQKELTQDEHSSEGDHVLTKVKRSAKDLEQKKKKKMDKKSSEDEESRHNNIELSPKNYKPKAIIKPGLVKPKHEPKFESPSSSEVEIPVGKSTEKKKPIKQQFKGIDPQGISEEISKIIRRIEEKKKKGIVTEKHTKKDKVKREKRGRATKDLTRGGKAQEYKYKLQVNPNLKVPHVCDIFELSKLPIIRQSDIILALLELGTNPDYYQFPYSPNSRMFWDDVLEYEEVKAIFQDYKGETLRKYWIMLNKTEDGHKIGELIRKHKSNMDTHPSKIKCIIDSIQEYFNGTNSHFSEKITTLHALRNPLKVVVDPISGDSFPTTRKFENKLQKMFLGSNYKEDPSEVIR
jgi:hypothetical protein